jgi:hypothetical protein
MFLGYFGMPGMINRIPGTKSIDDHGRNRLWTYALPSFSGGIDIST